ncbi:septal ring lytic transglycosylase RlpA family protein [Tepidamorphus sp. 3E244]|uniref:septal ring lytic transglycosylase RlpA family protein n=1 Tax=Tepidamorphus sp. 3E244 TaxID=3385498 RepID=UPI0038FC839C
MIKFVRAALVAAGVAFVAVGGGAIEADAATYQGVASWYGKAHHGRKTASGERFNMNAMTAAHKSLPFGTKVKVTNKRSGRSVVVRINDRGPYAGGRIIDLSRAAAQRLGLMQSGTAPVSVTIVR